MDRWKSFSLSVSFTKVDTEFLRDFMAKNNLKRAFRPCVLRAGSWLLSPGSCSFLFSLCALVAIFLCVSTFLLQRGFFALLSVRRSVYLWAHIWFLFAGISSSSSSPGRSRRCPWQFRLRIHIASQFLRHLSKCSRCITFNLFYLWSFLPRVRKYLRKNRIRRFVFFGEFQSKEEDVNQYKIIGNKTWLSEPSFSFIFNATVWRENFSGG